MINNSPNRVWAVLSDVYLALSLGGQVSYESHPNKVDLSESGPGAFLIYVRYPISHRLRMIKRSHCGHSLVTRTRIRSSDTVF